MQIKDYGAFVELEPGLDGLVHISEVAHKRVGNINDELEIGQIVKAKILEIDKDRKADQPQHQRDNRTSGRGRSSGS